MAKVPKEHTEARQLADVNMARSVYSKQFRADDKRRRVRRLVRNQLEGGRPMSDIELEENAEGWRSNFNPRDAESAESKTLLPYWEARTSSKYTINPIVHTGSQNGDLWANIFAENFDLFREDWGLDGEIEGRLLDKEYIRFGIGWLFFREKESPRGESIATGRILFPEKTKLTAGKWDMMCVRDDIGATELAKMLMTKESRKNAEHLGWNLKTIVSILKNADKDYHQTKDFRDEEEILDEIVANMSAVEELWPRTAIVYMYLKEEEGKIGKYIFTEELPSNSSSDADIKQAKADDDFLFVKQDYETSFKHIVAPILYEVANGKIHAVKGFGIRNFDWSNVLARMKNRAVDGSVFSSGMNFTSSNELTQEGPPVENYGAINLFPPGLTQLTEVANNQGSLRLIQFLEQNMAENNAIYKEQGSLIAQSETATQADILEGISNRVELVNISLYLTQYGGSIYTEQFRRLRMKGSADKDAKLFKERCLELRMPEEVFHTVFVVVLSGNDASSGNPATNQRLWKDTMEILSGRPGVNDPQLLENFVAARHGPRAVKKLLLPPEVEQDNAGKRSAKVENVMMAQGVPMDVVGSDDHIKHIPEHMIDLERIVQEFIDTKTLKNEGQIILVQLDMPHIDKHFAFIERDETLDKIRGQLMEKFNNLKQIAESMIDQFAQANEEQQRENSNG